MKYTPRYITQHVKQDWKVEQNFRNAVVLTFYYDYELDVNIQDVLKNDWQRLTVHSGDNIIFIGNNLSISRNALPKKLHAAI